MTSRNEPDPAPTAGRASLPSPSTRTREDPISPVTGLIDKTEELIGHSPHPAIVAVPIGAWTVSNICDGLALATGDDRYDDAASVSMAIGLAGAAGAIVTGLRDYSYIPEDRPSHGPATSHALGNAVVTTLFTTSYVLRLRDRRAGRRPSHLARLLGVAGGALSLYTAWLGGVLVEEYGESVKPAMEQEQGEESGSPDDPERDNDGPRGRERLSSRSPLGPHD
jgi:uncharacterized membrane protein